MLLVGRKLSDSKELGSRDYSTHRMKLFFTKGALFYAEYNLRLFWFLLRNEFDFLVSNDLDTLPACDLAAASKGKKLVYDSHEYFTEVPELQDRKWVKAFWEVMERMIFRNQDRMYTVNDSIAAIYSAKYGKNFRVVKNVPELTPIEKTKSKAELGLPEEKKILILQGAGINIDRGAEELTEAMRYLENGFLVIVGSGDVFPLLKQKIAEDALLQSRILLVGKLPYTEMMQYTLQADVGFSLDKNTNPNYLYSLPNKLFDYLKAGVPVIVSDLVEIGKVVREYQVGGIVHSHEPKMLAEFIQRFLEDEKQLAFYQSNCQRALIENSWEKQKIVLDEIYNDLV